MKSEPVSKEKLVEMFKAGATRKLEEHELFSMRAVERPERAGIYAELSTYVDIEWRYYDLAQHYYAEDFGYFENGLNEDLLLMTKESELPPKLYAEYLREVDPSERVNEKVTHAYLVNLKQNIGKVKEMLS